MFFKRRLLADATHEFSLHQTLNDEIITQNLEIASLARQNAELNADNANLVQRWLDKMNLTADEMNQDFEKEQANSVSKDKTKARAGEVEGDFHNGGKA